MDIDKMREIIADKLYAYPWESDVEIETSPANYGMEEIYPQLGKKDIWIDVPKRTFTFKGELSFSVRLVASGRGGYDESFMKPITGSGQFEFVKSSTDLEINKVSIDKELELYEGRPD